MTLTCLPVTWIGGFAFCICIFGRFLILLLAVRRSAISWEPAETVPGVKENVSERGLKVLAAGNISSWLHPKAFTEIELSTNWIINQEFARALAFDSSIKNKISTVHDLQRLANIVIRDQDRQT